MKKRLLPNWRFFAVVFFAPLAVQAGASAGLGYLPAVGPAPLRFMAEPRVFTNLVSAPLPPVEVTPVAPVIGPMYGPPVITVAGSTNAPEPTVDNQAQPPVELGPPDNTVSPQMFLKFFNKSTNVPTTIVTPMNFTPPKTVEPPASTATFSNGQ